MGKLSARSIGLGLAAPVGALVFAALVCSIILGATGHSPLDTMSAMVDSLTKPRLGPRTFVNSVNSATTYYLAAVAVAIGFRMRLFNIGVNGQYQLAAMIAAAIASASWMVGVPSVLRIALTLIAAMLVGAAWAGLAALLKVTRGVSEVISTIMLNAIATSLITFLLSPDRMGAVDPSGNDTRTAKIDAGGQVSGLSYPGTGSEIYGLIFLAAVVGIAYWFLLSRTRFGFELKATGLSESAAVASGVSVKRMVVYSLLLSGAAAGLVGMPALLGDIYTYSSQNFPSTVGFTGIAVALLGRNHPVGMAVASLLWGLLDNTANSLDVAGVPKEIVAIMQGVIVLSVVVAYELVRRYRVRLEQRDVGRALGTTKTPESADAEEVHA